MHPLVLRPAADCDLPFLSDLYATTRGEELAAISWPAAIKAQFAESQFALQHHHYLTQHPNADFLIVSRRGDAIGRLYVDRTLPVWRLIDVTILPNAQGSGAGRALLRWLQRAALDACVSGIDLHVLTANPRAAQLYARLGFVDLFSGMATHRRMFWTATVS